MPRFHSHLSLFMNLPLPGAPSTVFPVPAHSHRPGLSERIHGVLFPFLADFLEIFYHQSAVCVKLFPKNSPILKEKHPLGRFVGTAGFLTDLQGIYGKIAQKILPFQY